ncbi:transmembrane protein, putative (macronuclear) [Tetrahymena thermophila SB210]|uniref:Transmembrane protein, putative n=1 Tax=Tetrahymena thermophila (strain SB210) TaxID=312017 RepID=W7WYJ5_TETTS|nr:transmembrane protein, putative [Tetrahymena thermophila SB210]EWS71945.1 transmembrane protein, putative [Tetrahymena thermophila SB210]|eukprot:XP_012655505.1 transmembrane protein, putative [Tetrahymena thermophila SB210]
MLSLFLRTLKQNQLNIYLFHILIQFQKSKSNKINFNFKLFLNIFYIIDKQIKTRYFIRQICIIFDFTILFYIKFRFIVKYLKLIKSDQKIAISYSFNYIADKIKYQLQFKLLNKLEGKQIQNQEIQRKSKQNPHKQNIKKEEVKKQKNLQDQQMKDFEFKLINKQKSFFQFYGKNDKLKFQKLYKMINRTLTSKKFIALHLINFNKIKSSFKDTLFLFVKFIRLPNKETR